MPRSKRVRVVTSSTQMEKPASVIVQNNNPKVPKLTENEKRARRYATTTSMGMGMRAGNNLSNFGFRTADVMDSQTSQFYSPQLSSDFLEKPQNLRERRAFYRFFYNTNEIVRRAVDIHSTLPLSKLRLVPPKGKNKHQNEYVYKFFVDMCDNMKLFKSLIEIAFEFNLMGNCAAKDAEIKVGTGYKLAQNVEIGDILLTDKGRYRRVTKKCQRPVEEILRIKCWKDFRDLPVTEEHPIEVLREDKFVFAQAGDLTVSDYVRVTWPTEVVDIEKISLSFPNNYTKVNGGYSLNFVIPRGKDLKTIEARKIFVSWLSSLTEPVIKSREDLAQELGLTKSKFNSLIFTLDQDIEQPYHRRLPSSGIQGGSKVQWLPLKESVEITDSYDIKMTRLVSAIDEIIINDDFAYLAGFWLGDGTLARDNSRDHWGRGLWQISFSEKETENIGRIRDILIKIFGQESITEWTSKGMTYLKVISNPAFVEWWADNFGETSFGKNHKRIPQWFVNLPIEKLLNFMAGVLDSDGSNTIYEDNYTGLVKISMASRSIMDSVRDIAFKCGTVVGYRCAKERDVILPCGDKSVSKKMYEITASDEESCLLLSKYANKKMPDEAVFTTMSRYWIRTEEGIAFKIKNIETEKYEDLVYNFEVEEDHTYQVAGFSTHNCFIFTEESDWREDLEPAEAAKKIQQSKQRSEFLKQKYDIVDKDPLYKGWDKLLILPPDQVRVRKLPLSDGVAVEYLPDPETRKFLTSDIAIDPLDPTKRLKSSVSRDLREKIRQSGVIPLDTDPNTGSHVYHLARKKSQYEPLGTSMIECCINTLVLMDKLRQAQTSIASRHMTPMRVVWAEGLNQDDTDNLREQVDMALVDPDFSIIANYEVHWEEMGTQGRLLDIDAENESSLNRLFAGMGVTREILTGEGTYTGSKVSLEIMNTEYLLFREILQDYVENYLFKPVARKKGFIEYDDYGNEVLIYPRLSFTRLAIRDNEQFFDAAFQLYQKGSISVDLILDILNIDPESTRQKIEKDLFTVNDSIFNEVLRNIYTNVAAPLVEKTNLTQKLAEYLKLEMAAEPPAQDGGASRFSSTKELPEIDQNRKIKLAKVMKYFQSNPDALDRILNKS